MRPAFGAWSVIAALDCGSGVEGFGQSPKYLFASAKPSFAVISPPTTRIALSGRSKRLWRSCTVSDLQRRRGFWPVSEVLVRECEAVVCSDITAHYQNRVVWSVETAVELSDVCRSE